MSWLFGAQPEICVDCPTEVEKAIVPRSVDLGGFEVHRALPFNSRQLVGPFIFWDQMGPGEFSGGQGVDVRPHPHIGLSTVTYLFKGSLDHKDSLGNAVRILPGDVNLMSAGSGIVHSERTGQDIRLSASQLYGIQSWLAQSQDHEGGAPQFHHYSADELPEFTDSNVSGRVILGEFAGVRSPVATQWETLYADIRVKKDSIFFIPADAEERAIYLTAGTLEIGISIYAGRQMILFRPGSPVTFKALTDIHLLLLGGASMDSRRYLWWNFVSSSVEKIQAAAEDWQNGNFSKVPGDEEEFIPLPELPLPAE